MINLIINYFSMILSYGVFGIISWLMSMACLVTLIIIWIKLALAIKTLNRIKKLEKEALDLNTRGAIEIDI